MHGQIHIKLDLLCFQKKMWGGVYPFWSDSKAVDQAGYRVLFAMLYKGQSPDTKKS